MLYVSLVYFDRFKVRTFVNAAKRNVSPFPKAPWTQGISKRTQMSFTNLNQTSEFRIV